MLLCLSLLCWLLNYLLVTTPYLMGVFFAAVLLGLQGYVLWRMVRWGEVRARGAKRRRQQLLPFFYRRNRRGGPVSRRQYAHEAGGERGR